MVCLCVANVAFAQNYYDEYQTGPQQQQQQQHRPAPARLSPSNGPVTEKPQPVAILKQINRYVGVLLLIAVFFDTRGLLWEPRHTLFYVTETKHTDLSLTQFWGFLLTCSISSMTGAQTIFFNVPTSTRLGKEEEVLEFTMEL